MSADTREACRARLARDFPTAIIQDSAFPVRGYYFGVALNRFDYAHGYGPTWADAEAEVRRIIAAEAQAIRDEDGLTRDDFAPPRPE